MNSRKTISVIAGLVTISVMTLSLSVFAEEGIAGPGQHVLRDQLIDRHMGAFRDPVIMRMRLIEVPSWPGLTGAPAYNQAPFYSPYMFNGMVTFPLAPYLLPGGMPPQPSK